MVWPARHGAGRAAAIAPGPVVPQTTPRSRASAAVPYPVVVDVYRLRDVPALQDPVLIAALDGWVDAGSAATQAVGRIVEDAPTIVEFDPDALFDYRSRRPTLDIVDGRLSELTWPELSIRHANIGGRDLLVLTGQEPDDRWRTLSESVVELAKRLGVVEWMSLGAIPAAVPHTRPVPVLGTASAGGELRGVDPGPAGLLRVPAAALSVLELRVGEAGVPSVGYFAQIPHYVSGAYPAAAAELLRVAGRHLDVELPVGDLDEEARLMRIRLDMAAASEETTRSYVQRLESMVDESRLPAGDELIADIERFLRERGGTEGGRPN
jgi:proteasome assembly chaperone (PAC2) family protein